MVVEFGTQQPSGLVQERRRALLIKHERSKISVGEMFLVIALIQKDLFDSLFQLDSLVPVVGTRKGDSNC